MPRIHSRYIIQHQENPNAEWQLVHEFSAEFGLPASKKRKYVSLMNAEYDLETAKAIAGFLDRIPWIPGNFRVVKETENRNVKREVIQ